MDINLTYPKTPASGFHGMEEYTGSTFRTAVCLAEDIKPGLGICYFDRSVAKKDLTVKVPKQNTSKIVFDADFVTANVINGTVNTVAWAAITFDTDHDTTAELLRAAIQAVSTVDTCTIDPLDATNRTFLIKGTVAAGNLTVTEAVTLGATQADGTITYSTSDIFLGWLRADNDDNYITDSEYTKKAGQSGSAVEQGGIHVYLDDSVTPEIEDDVYIIATDANSKAGYATNVSTGNLATGAKFRSIETSDRAVVRVNRP